MRGGSSRYVVAVMVMGAVLLSMSAVGFKLSLPGRGTPRLVSDAAGVESNWQGTWYTLVDTGSGPSCTGVLGTEQWPATFAKDWVTGPVFATYSDNLCFGATIPVYVRQSGAYHFDLKNVDDGARLFDGNGNVLIEASCGSFNCPVQSGKDVNLVQGKGELGLQFWQYGGRASVSFLAQDTSIFRNGAPTSTFTYSPSTVLAGETVSFSSTSVDTDGDSMNYLWDFGTSFDSRPNPTHAFSTLGMHRVTLTVTDEFGASSSASQDLVVGARPLVAHAAASPASGQAPLEVSFTCSVDQGTPPMSVEWSFGDGTGTQSGAAVSHTYASGGSFTATCSVTDSAGHTATSSVPVSVSTGVLSGIGPLGFAGGVLTLLSVMVVAAVVAIALVVSRRRRRQNGPRR